MTVWKYSKAAGISLILSLVLASPLIVILDQNLIDTRLNVFSDCVAVTAYTAWLLAVLFVSRWPLLDKGLRKMSPKSGPTLHKALGPMSLLLALLHYVITFSMHESIVYSGIGGGIVVLIAVLGMAYMKPSMLRIWLHRLAVAGILLIWFHVHMIVRLTAITPFIMLFDAYTAIVLILYIWYRLLK